MYVCQSSSNRLIAFIFNVTICTYTSLLDALEVAIFVIIEVASSFKSIGILAEF